MSSSNIYNYSLYTRIHNSINIHIYIHKDTHTHICARTNDITYGFTRDTSHQEGSEDNGKYRKEERFVGAGDNDKHM